MVCGVGVDTEPERVDALAREFVAEGAALDPGFCISIGKAGELELGLRIRLGLAHESIRDLEPTQRFARLESVRALGVAVDDTEQIVLVAVAAGNKGPHERTHVVCVSVEIEARHIARLHGIVGVLPFRRDVPFAQPELEIAANPRHAQDLFAKLGRRL